MARAPRDTFKYRFCDANGEQLHCGITNNLGRREGEHRRKFRQPDGFIEQIGRRSSRTSAAAWERTQRCSPYNRDEPATLPKRVRLTAPRQSRGRSVGKAIEGFVQGAAIAGGVLALGAILGGALRKRP